MSSDGGREAPGEGDRHGEASERPPARTVAARRIGVVAFAALFVVLFAVVGISEGIGDPSVPEGAVAVVEDAPAGLGVVTQAEFDRAFDQIVAAQRGEAAPAPGDPRYDQFVLSALFTVLESIWLQGTAEERGIEASDERIAAEVEKVKAENFQSDRAYEEFLDESAYTPGDFEERVMLQILSDAIEKEVREEAPKPSKSEIETYYESAKVSQFTEAETRDFRHIVNKDRVKIERALQALRADDSAKNWAELARRLSESPSGKRAGGLVEEISSGLFPTNLDDAIFGAPIGVVEGPIRTRQGYNIFAVTRIYPEEPQPLGEVERQVENRLSRRAERESFAAFVTDFNTTWRARTFCAPEYAIERCSNYKGDGRPENAPAACYEADPQGGRLAACPPVVFQLVPAMPGSVTPLTPQGNPLAQRPHPAGGEEEESAPPGN